MRRILAVLIAAAALAPAAQAVEKEDFLLQTAVNLGALCGAPADPAAIHTCEGYLAGVNQMHDAIGEAFGGRVYCLPSDGSVTRDSAAAAFSAWAAATPAAASMPASEGVLVWARLTYPCQ